MQNLQNHIRNYELVEDSCNALFSSVLISDKQLKTPTTSDRLSINQHRAVY